MVFIITTYSISPFIHYKLERYFLKSNKNAATMNGSVWYFIYLHKWRSMRYCLNIFVIVNCKPVTMIRLHVIFTESSDCRMRFGRKFSMDCNHVQYNYWLVYECICKRLSNIFILTFMHFARFHNTLVMATGIWRGFLLLHFRLLPNCAFMRWRKFIGA
jgi:hypothetical protein